MAYLIIGNGQLGKEFQRFFEENGVIYCMITHKDVDISDNLNINFEIEQCLNEYPIETIINCAAYNNVEKAEYDIKEAYKINSVGPKNLAAICDKNNLKLVHFSTDYVFGNTKDNYIFRPETSKTGPLSIYGMSKLKGEEYVINHCNNYLILRTSWLYGKFGNNFVSKVLKKALKEDSILELPGNTVGKPTYTKDLVNQTMLLLENHNVGLYHAANNGIATTWYDYCKKIFEILNINKQIKKIYNKNHIRPENAPLLNAALDAENLNIMRDWDVALKDYLFNDMEMEGF